jgi:translation initiation factor 1A
MLGDRRILAKCYERSSKSWYNKLIHIRGKFRKRVYVNIGDYVLVSTREFETGDVPDSSGAENIPFGGDVIHVYNQNEVRKLVRLGEFILEETEADATETKNSKLQFMDSDDERAYNEAAEKHRDDENDDEDGPKRVAVAPQQRCLDMPSSDSSNDDSMDAEELKQALDAL